jgi:hypothetical protein
MSLKKVRGFLALPGELRNNVYRYYFQADFRCELVAQGTHLDLWHSKPKTTTSSTIRVSRRLAKYTRVQGLQTSWSGSLYALVIVCKQVHSESIAFLYQNTTFVFNAPRRMNNFLNALPAANLALITKLELHYANYANPGLVQHNYLSQRSLATWTRACRDMAKQLSNLRELHVWLYVTDTPLFFDLRQEWLTPLLPFRRLCLSRQSSESKTGVLLDMVKVWLNTWWSRT